LSVAFSSARGALPRYPLLFPQGRCSNLWQDFMTRDELNLLEKYLRKTFQTVSIEIRQRPKKKDSAEVYVADEFVGVIYRDDEDGEVSYQFQMAILELDLK
jgi:hypothetical protein